MTIIYGIFGLSIFIIIITLFGMVINKWIVKSSDNNFLIIALLGFTGVGVIVAISGLIYVFGLLIEKLI